VGCNGNKILRPRPTDEWAAAGSHGSWRARLRALRTCYLRLVRATMCARGHWCGFGATPRHGRKRVSKDEGTGTPATRSTIKGPPGSLTPRWSLRVFKVVNVPPCPLACDVRNLCLAQFRRSGIAFPPLDPSYVCQPIAALRRLSPWPWLLRALPTSRPNMPLDPPVAQMPTATKIMVTPIRARSRCNLPTAALGGRRDRSTAEG